MNDKAKIEELKLENEKLKNKTEKLRLFRNIVAVASIIISLISFLVLNQGSSNETSTESNKTDNTQVQGDIKDTQVQSGIKDISTQSGVDNTQIDSDDDDDDDLD